MAHVFRGQSESKLLKWLVKKGHNPWETKAFKSPDPLSLLQNCFQEFCEQKKPWRSTKDLYAAWGLYTALRDSVEYTQELISQWEESRKIPEALAHSLAQNVENLTQENDLLRMRNERFESQRHSLADTIQQQDKELKQALLRAQATEEKVQVLETQLQETQAAHQQEINNLQIQHETKLNSYEVGQKGYEAKLTKCEARLADYATVYVEKIKEWRSERISLYKEIKGLTTALQDANQKAEKATAHAQITEQKLKETQLQFVQAAQETQNLAEQIQIERETANQEACHKDKTKKGKPIQTVIYANHGPHSQYGAKPQVSNQFQGQQKSGSQGKGIGFMRGQRMRDAQQGSSFAPAHIHRSNPPLPPQGPQQLVSHPDLQSRCKKENRQPPAHSNWKKEHSGYSGGGHRSWANGFSPYPYGHSAPQSPRNSGRNCQPKNGGLRSPQYSPAQAGDPQVPIKSSSPGQRQTSGQREVRKQTWRQLQALEADLDQLAGKPLSVLLKALTKLVEDRKNSWEPSATGSGHCASIWFQDKFCPPQSLLGVPQVPCFRLRSHG